MRSFYFLKMTEGPVCFNLFEEVFENGDYRNVVYTDPDFQLVYMNLIPGEDIPWEIHGEQRQFIVVLAGRGIVEVKGFNSCEIYKGMSVIIPPGYRHYVKNTSETEDLKLFTTYNPPEHRAHLIQHEQPNE